MTDWTPSARQLQREQIVARLRLRRALIAGSVTVVVLGALIALLVTSPGWQRVQETFLDPHHAKESFPLVLDGFWVNVKMFLVAEPLILLVGILVAVTRSTITPWLAPVRLVAVIYTDLLRGIPTLLVVAICALGIPALRLVGVTTSLFWLSVFALVLSYGAYVAEVIRSGIESVHPTQLASAEALALSRGQAMRFVILPQALRRVVPPLMNDFVSLQKDTSLISYVGVVEALRAATDYGNYNFNFTPLVVAAALFVALTVPLARFTDWLSRRAARKMWGR